METFHPITTLHAFSSSAYGIFLKVQYGKIQLKSLTRNRTKVQPNQIWQDQYKVHALIII